jgi:adenylate cyclase
MRRRVRLIRIPWRGIQNVLLAAGVATFSVYYWPPEKNNNQWLVPLNYLERAGYDALFATRGEKLESVSPRIEIVGFDRESERVLESKYPASEFPELKTTWPPSRRFHADVIRNLKKAGATLIVYDVLFSGASTPEDDIALDKAIKEAGNVVLTSRVDRNFTQLSKSLEEPHYDDDLGIDFLAAARVGFAEVPTDADKIVRRFVPTMKFRDEWIPSLASAAFLAFTGKEDTDIRVEKDKIIIGGQIIPRTGPTVLDLVDKAPVPSAYMDFPAGNGTFPMTSFGQVAFDEFSKSQYNQFNDKIVFVGVIGNQLTKEISDEYVTAFSRFMPDATGGIAVTTVPGVVLQAQNFNALLSATYVTHWPDWSLWLILFGFTLIGAGGVRRYYNWRGPAVLLLLMALFLIVVHAAFVTYRIHMPYIVPTILMFSSISMVAYLERGSLRRKWSGYVSPEVLEQILRTENDPDAKKILGTVVFGDIRGFTAFTNKHPAERVVALLNIHFEKMTDIIYEEQGTIDKFLGDGIMALFGIPIRKKDSAISAVRAAWRMCESSKQPMYYQGSQYFMDSGFGITTGTLIAGHVGGRARHDFTVIGDVVNMAARLQGVTGEPDVIIDQATYELVKNHFEVESLGRISVKGAPEPIQCYKVTGQLDAKEMKVIPKLRRGSQNPVKTPASGFNVNIGNHE